MIEIIIVAVVVATVAVVGAVIHEHHWPNGAAAPLAWDAMRLMRCRHKPYRWYAKETGGRFKVGCSACEYARWLKREGARPAATTDVDPRSPNRGDAKQGATR